MSIDDHAARPETTADLAAEGHMFRPVTREALRTLRD
jgi:hypothetical protein